MQIKLILVFTSLSFLVGCTQDIAQKIVDQAIEFQNGDLIDKSTFAFDFRDKHYVSSRKSGTYSYQRSYQDTMGKVDDFLTNETFVRKVNGVEVNVDEEWKTKYSNSINSVFYFAYLPFGLNDGAVKKEYLGSETIAGIHYECIKIGFDKNGGGTDHDDVFYYWFEKQTKSLDYFAYSYHTDGGGIRFRKAYNSRRVNGIQFQDYINYSPEKSIEHSVKIEDILALYKANQLVELSRIDTENITF